VAPQPDYATFDIIGALTFGESFGCLEQSEFHPWVALIFASVRAGDIIGYLKRYTITRFLMQVFLGKQMTAKRLEHMALTRDKADRRVDLGPAGYGTNDFMS
jgi:hypothetical protein